MDKDCSVCSKKADWLLVYKETSKIKGALCDGCRHNGYYNPVIFDLESIEPVDPCFYIRDFYGIPAKVGMRIKIHSINDGPATTGVIKGADHYLYCLMDGEKEPKRFHPTHLIDYLDDSGNIIASYGDY